MKKYPRISIVVPSYNQGEFIEETLQSIIGQNYPNLQLIVVDGASTDSTLSVLDKYVESIDILISESDDGQTEAINKGLKLIDGDIWAYLCSDDVYNGNIFHRVASLFNEGESIIYGNCTWVNDKTKLLAKKKPRNPFSLSGLYQDNYIYQPSVFLSKAVIKKIGYFDESLHYGMDYEYWLRASQEFKFTYVDLFLSKYRLHFSSKSVKHVKQMRFEMIRIQAKYGFGDHAKRQYRKFVRYGFYLYRIKQFLYAVRSKLLNW